MRNNNNYINAIYSSTLDLQPIATSFKQKDIIIKLFFLFFCGKLGMLYFYPLNPATLTN